MKMYSLPLRAVCIAAGVILVATLSRPLVAATAPTPAAYTTKKDIFYGAEAYRADPHFQRCRLDLYIPEGVTDFPTVVWFHAGGLNQGNRYIPGELMKQGMAVVALGYRIYPDAHAPEFIEDAAAGVAWVFNNIGSYGGSTKRIFVAGASAGGYLSSMIGLDRSWLAAHGIEADRLAGIVALSGQAITHVAVREEHGGKRYVPVVDALAPLNHVRADAPPYLLVTGDRELELLGRYEENAYMKRMMEVVGHKQTELYELKGMDHSHVEKPGHAYLLQFVKRISATR